MPVYLFTFHAYRSWMPDHPRGFVQEGRGIQPPNKALANAYANAAVYPEVKFDTELQRLLIENCREICARRDWHVHGAATESTHLHVLVSWRSDVRWQDVRGKIRNLLSLLLSRRSQQVGRPWFSTGASRKRIRDQPHFDYLMAKYLPKHRGIKWFEDRGWMT